MTLIAGVHALRSTPVDAIPDISDNQVIVFTEWPGRSPLDVEKQITYPLSTALQGIAGVRDIRGRSGFGLSMLYVVFDDGTEFYWARTRVLERLQMSSGELPDGVQPVLGPDATPLGQIFWYYLDGPEYDLGTLRSLQDWVVRLSLQAVPGVAEVASVGGFVPEYQVNIDPDRLNVYGVTFHDVRHALVRTNVDVGANTLERSGMELVIRGVGSLQSLEDVENVVVALRGDNPLFLREIADVSLGPAFRRGALADEHGERVGGAVTMRYGENPSEVIERVERTIDSVQESLPAGIRIVPFYDRTQLVDETTATLTQTLVAELLVVFAVILFFLLTVRISLIVATALPIGILLAFAGMRVLGIDSNIMSLAGIAIAIGTMVDMAIVVSENVLSHLQRPDDGSSRPARVVTAVGEVAPAISAAMATTVVAFLPVFLLSGQAGKLFAPLAWTKTLCMLGSLLVAIVLIPVLCLLFLKDGESGAEAARGRAPVHVLLAAAAGFLVGWHLPSLGVLPALRAIWPALLTGLLFGAAAARVHSEQLVPVERNRVSQAIYRWYVPALRAVLAHRRRFAGGAALLVFLGLLQYGGVRMFLWPLHAGADAMGAQLSRVEPVATLESWFPPIDEAFMPPLDEGSFLYMPSLLHQASLDQTVAAMVRMNRRMREVHEVDQIMGKAGRAVTALDPAPVGMIETIVNLKPRRLWRPGSTKETVLAELRAKTEMLGVSPSWLQPIETRVIMLQSDLRAAMALKIIGSPLGRDGRPLKDREAHDALEGLALALERVVRQTPGATHVNALRIGGKPYLELAVDQRRAARFNVNARDVLDVVEVALGGKKLTYTLEGRARYPVRVQYPPDLRVDTEAIGRLLIPTNSVADDEITVGAGHHAGHRPPEQGIAAPGTPVPLRWLVDIREVVGPALVRSENGQLTGYVMFNAGDGAEERVMDDVLATVARWREGVGAQKGDDPVPRGLRIEPAGRYLTKVEADRRLALILPLVLLVNLILIYLAMRELGLTLAIFAAIPISFAGGFLALWLYPVVSGSAPVHLTTAVWVGFIALFGISVDDGVLIGTHLRQRFEGRRPSTVEEVREIVVEAGLRRIRPALMTTATTVLALLPVLWSSGRGSDVMRPMALPVLGGLFVSVVTLFTVPAVYSWLQERRLDVTRAHGSPQASGIVGMVPAPLRTGTREL